MTHEWIYLSDEPAWAIANGKGGLQRAGSRGAPSFNKVAGTTKVPKSILVFVKQHHVRFTTRFDVGLVTASRDTCPHNLLLGAAQDETMDECQCRSCRLWDIEIFFTFINYYQAP